MAVPSTLLQYFQQVRPLAKCDKDDGRVVGHLLANLLNNKPADPAHAIREFANRTAMLRECAFPHIGAMLVAMLSADTHSGSEQTPLEDEAQDPASVTEDQATTIGRILAASVSSSQVPALALRQIVDSHSLLLMMTTQHAWFFPMLEVLLALPAAANPRRSTIMRRLTTGVTPQSMVDVPSIPNFDSVVRALWAASQALC